MANTPALFISPNCLLVECIITPSGGSTLSDNKFEDQQNLIGRPIIGITSFCSLDMNFSPLSAGVAVIPPQVFNSAFLSIQRAGLSYPDGKGKMLSVGEGLYYQNIPLAAMRTAAQMNTSPGPTSSNVNNPFWVRPMTWQWPLSKVSFPTPVAITQKYSVPFLLHYLLPGEDKTPYGG